MKQDTLCDVLTCDSGNKDSSQLKLELIVNRDVKGSFSAFKSKFGEFINQQPHFDRNPKG